MKHKPAAKQKVGRLTPRKLRRIRRVAFHEAGHAVQTWVEGFQDGRIKFRTVTIVPGVDDLGHVLGERFLKGLNPDIAVTARGQWLMESQIRILMAGGIAERHFDPRGYRHEGGRSDREKAIDLLTYIEPDVYGTQECFNLHWRLMVAQTRTYIMHHRSLVKVVARALLVHRTLSWDDFLAVVRGESARSAGWEEPKSATPTVTPPRSRMAGRSLLERICANQNATK